MFINDYLLGGITGLFFICIIIFLLIKYVKLSKIENIQCFCCSLKRRLDPPQEQEITTQV